MKIQLLFLGAMFVYWHNFVDIIKANHGMHPFECSRVIPDVVAAEISG